jgi:hypothetical protein
MRHSAGIGIRPPTDIETDTIDTNHQNFIYSLSNKLISMQNGGSNFDDIFYSAGIPKPIVVGTYNKIKELLKKYGDWYNVVVVDESQQFIPLPTDNYMTKDMLDKISSFLEIVKYSKSNKKGGCVQLMTGSVNLKSLTDIQTMLNTNFSDTRKFFMKAYGNNTAVDTEFGDGDKDVINPETGKRIKIGNRADIVVMPYEKLSGMATDSRKAIIDIVHRKISEKNYWNVIAIFGAKRTAQKGIYRIIEEAIDG